MKLIVEKGIDDLGAKRCSELQKKKQRIKLDRSQFEFAFSCS